MEDNKLTYKIKMESNGITSEQLKKNYGKSVVIGMLSAFLLMSLMLSYLMINKLTIDLEKKHAMIIKEITDKGDCIHRRDSLTREVERLSIYETLSRSMAFRDDATRLLKHKVGDIVYSKQDSSQVVISDIVIGGSKYEYYVKYRITHKDNTIEEVIPELLY